MNMAYAAIYSCIMTAIGNLLIRGYFLLRPYLNYKKID